MQAPILRRGRERQRQRQIVVSRAIHEAMLINDDSFSARTVDATRNALQFDNAQAMVTRRERQRTLRDRMKLSPVVTCTRGAQEHQETSSHLVSFASLQTVIEQK